MRKFAPLILISLLSIIFSNSASAGDYITVNGFEVRHKIMTVTAMPGQVLIFENIEHDDALFSSLEILGDSYVYKVGGAEGLETLRLSTADQTITLNILVLSSFNFQTQKAMNGYMIGQYKSGYKGQSRYQPPTGFIRVSPELAELQVSPSYQLKQFKCKQSFSGGDYYLMLDPHLLHNLELVTQEARRKGWLDEGQSLTIMSGWRSPSYNRSIGNNTSVSRHLYGDAADIYVDRNNDGRMDDLNDDGKSNKADAVVLKSLIDTIIKQADTVWYKGGFAVYKEKPHRGPFVHIDTRGYSARW